MESLHLPMGVCSAAQDDPSKALGKMLVDMFFTKRRKDKYVTGDHDGDCQSLQIARLDRENFDAQLN